MQCPLPGALPQLALEDEHLLPKSRDLPVTIIPAQASHRRGQGRQGEEKRMPDRAGRMIRLDGEVNMWSRELANCPREGPRTHRPILGPYGLRATKADVLCEGRRLAVVAGTLEDSFDAFAVHVYRFR